MIGRQEFYDRRCVAGLIHVVQQVPLRASVRGALAIDNSTAGLLLLWSLLRWERTFAIRTLECMGIDLWSLTREVDEALKACGKRGGEVAASEQTARLDACLRKWLDRTAEQARSLQHTFVGIEHLLLAMLAQSAPPFEALFQHCGLTYETLKNAIVAGISAAAPPPLAVVEILDAEPAGGAALPAKAAEIEHPPAEAAPSWVAEIDRPAIGVPRRFGVFLMMLMVTFYAVLFSVLTVLRATPVVFALMAFLFTGIGIGQAVLFGGRFPRAASIWAGSILVPIEAVIFCSIENDFLYFGRMSRGSAIAAGIAVVIVCIPMGAILGYLFGTVTAGGFYLVDRYEKRRQR